MRLRGRNSLCAIPPADLRATCRSDAGGGAGGDASLVCCATRAASAPPLALTATRVRSQALVAAIRGRGQQNSSFLDALAEKYCGAVPKRGGKREEPSADSTAAKARKRR